MASSSGRNRRSLNTVAFAIALTLHVMLAVMLATVRQPQPLHLPEFEIPPAPYEVFLVPKAGGSPQASARPGAGEPGRAGAGLRTLEPRATPSASAAATPLAAPERAANAPAPQGAGLRGAVSPAEMPTPPVLAPPVPPLQAAPPPSLARPTPPELRPVQTPPIPPPEPPLPTLAAQPPLQLNQPPALRRPDQLELRAVEAPVAPPPEPPLPTLAVRSEPVQVAPPPAIARAPAPALRPVQAPSIAPPEPPLPTLAARPAPVQVAPPPALARTATPTLRPVQGPNVPTPDAPLPTLAARAAPLQIAAPPSVTGRTGGGLALRPLQTPGQGFAAASGGADGPAAPTGAGPGGAPGQAGAGAPGAQAAGPHPGCAIEVLMLLTPEERTRCRYALDALAERQAAARESEARARRVAEAMNARRVDTLAPEKRAFFDAVTAAKEAVRNGIGRPPTLACNLGALFGGKGGAPAQKVKIPGLPCSIIPPLGAGTEEWALTPP